MRIWLACAVVVACSDPPPPPEEPPDFGPEDEVEGMFVGTMQPPCTCEGGAVVDESSPLIVYCTGGAERVTLVLPFYEIAANLRGWTPGSVYVEPYEGFAEAVGWYGSTIIDDPRGAPYTGRYRELAIEHAFAGPQELCIRDEHGSTGDCVFGYQGFTIDNAKLWCEVRP